MGSDEWIGFTVAPACGFYLPPALSSAACDAVQNRCVIPGTKLLKLHAWKMAKNTAQASWRMLGLFESLGPEALIKHKSLHQWKTHLLHTNAVVLKNLSCKTENARGKFLLYLVGIKCVFSPSLA